MLTNPLFHAMTSCVPNVLYIPEDPEFPAVDCWTQNEMFQTTISAHHPIACTAKKFLKLRAMGVPNILIFVVPKALATEFKRQKFVNSTKAISEEGFPGGWNDLKQYVLGL